ncbi:uncharacterized protein LOC133718859 [Rosa rugosa]|uniref:uncharacterized protein LOC133718859 n=1 Tax=Rosa rugosa TaxID=74645 RepID=UPI002B40942B|nr:uncharacterized protein LOC133718859 [Rosa rugosa]
MLSLRELRTLANPSRFGLGLHQWRTVPTSSRSPLSASRFLFAASQGRVYSASFQSEFPLAEGTYSDFTPTASHQNGFEVKGGFAIAGLPSTEISNWFRRRRGGSMLSGMSRDLWDPSRPRRLGVGRRVRQHAMVVSWVWLRGMAAMWSGGETDRWFLTLGQNQHVHAGGPKTRRGGGLWVLWAMGVVNYVATHYNGCTAVDMAVVGMAGIASAANGWVLTPWWVPRSVGWPKSQWRPNPEGIPRSDRLMGVKWVSKASWNVGTKLMNSGSMGFRIWDPGGLIRITTLMFIIGASSLDTMGLVLHQVNESSGVPQLRALAKEDSNYFIFCETTLHSHIGSLNN